MIAVEPAGEKRRDLEIQVPRSETKALESIRDWVFTYTGLNYPPRKNGILYSRLQSLCYRLSIANIVEMDRLLTECGSDWLATEVARAVSTNYTFFFREQETFDFLRKFIVPSLPAGETWRIWSAAASSGEEAYSVAILLIEIFGQEQARQKASILGTDINYHMIAQAEAGAYSEQRLEAFPKDLQNKYFSPSPGKMWRLSSAVRELCTFRRLNLMSQPWPFRQPFQVILCRNIFYYFDKSEQFELAERLYDAAAPGGWLLTSVTENFYAMPIRWKRVVAGVWRKTA